MEILFLMLTIGAIIATVFLFITAINKDEPFYTLFGGVICSVSLVLVMTTINYSTFDTTSKNVLEEQYRIIDYNEQNSFIIIDNSNNELIPFQILDAFSLLKIKKGDFSVYVEKNITKGGAAKNSYLRIYDIHGNSLLKYRDDRLLTFPYRGEDQVLEKKDETNG